VNKNCAVYKTSEILGKRWTILILLELYKEKNKWKRYSYLKNRLMNITPKILSERLKELQKEKLIERKMDVSSFPIKTEYSLTKSGEELIKVMEEMKRWALKWKINNKECRKMKCRDCDF